MSETLGGNLGAYRLETMLGTGSVGQVYRGVHRQSGRAVAIKVMHAHLAHDPSFRARFRQEAAAVDALRHPNLVESTEFGEESGRYYLVMELMTAGSVRALLQQRVIPGQAWSFPEAPGLVRQAADGLAYAHRKGMVHRDIKPDNLLLQRTAGPGEEAPTVKISDFGLVRMAEGSMLTVTGVVMGTPAYMSPEQCQGAELDGRSDIYSLGVVLYEAATGLLPFEIRSLREAYDRHVRVAPIPPRQALPSLSARLEQIILRCLAKPPADRYQSAEALAADLGSLMGGARPTPRGASVAEPSGGGGGAGWPAGRAGAARWRASSS